MVLAIEARARWSQEAEEVRVLGLKGAIGRWLADPLNTGLYESGLMGGQTVVTRQKVGGEDWAVVVVQRAGGVVMEVGMVTQETDEGLEFERVMDVRACMFASSDEVWGGVFGADHVLGEFDREGFEERMRALKEEVVWERAGLGELLAVRD